MTLSSTVILDIFRPTSSRELVPPAHCIQRLDPHFFAQKLSLVSDQSFQALMVATTESLCWPFATIQQQTTIGRRSEHTASSPPVCEQQVHSPPHLFYVPQHRHYTNKVNIVSYTNPVFPFDRLNNLGLFSLPSFPLLSGENEAGIELSDFLFFKPRSSF
jgi:hypothetical protein